MQPGIRDFLNLADRAVFPVKIFSFTIEIKINNDYICVYNNAKKNVPGDKGSFIHEKSFSYRQRLDNTFR